MNLAKCPDCKTVFSENALTCPGCECPKDRFIIIEKKDKSNNLTVVFQLVGIIVIIFFVINWLNNYSKSPENQKEQRIQAKEEKEHNRRVAKHGEEPDESTVKYFLVRIAKDPDSVKIYSSVLRYNEKDGYCFLVDSGGKNSFGGMTRNLNWFVVDKGNIQMKDSNAYTP